MPEIASILGVLEAFLRESLNAAGGVWDEVEPQVYDVLWPDAAEPVRLTFDPEALPEHPAAQLVTFGSPVLDQLLERARTRARVGLAYLDQAPPAVETVAAQIITGERGPAQAIPVTLTWDPVAGKLDAAACPHCQQPAYEFRLTPHRELRCPGCASLTTPRHP